MDQLSSTRARAYEAEAAIGAGMDDEQMSEHMKAMWAGQSNILVSVRVRPIMKHDVVKKSCVRVLDGKVVVILDPMAENKINVLRANRSREKQYAFDHVFEPSSSQEAVFHHTTKFLIHGVLDGYNATVFAYGQTGSGKTYTMIGTEENPGIMVRVMMDLFSVSAAQAAANVLTYKVTVSFLEVYNENIRDLLSSENSMDDYLDLREDPIKGPMVAGITEVEAKTSGEIMRLLHQGNARRSQAATAANEVSSRSHAVLQVIVEARDSASGQGVVDNIKVGKLSLVDLAGSERAANTQNRGARLVEGANINRSLLALGNCINALGEKGNKGNFVPYRDSKLTRLLKDSLGGNCRTVMIANISAAESSFEETLNTLKYANRAKNIKTEAKRNVLNVNYHISEYVELINNLRGEIKVLKDQIETNAPGDGDAPSAVSEFEAGSESDLKARHGMGMGGGGNVPYGLEIPNPNGNNNSGPGVPAGGHSPSDYRPLGPSTPMQAVRDSLRSGGGLHGHGTRNNSAQGGETRELVNSMRQMIVSNFQERMQLRRSLIELEDQNVQNSIEVSKRQLMVVQWTEKSGIAEEFGEDMDLNNADLSAAIIAKAPTDVATAWRECEQIRKAVAKNNSMKRSIAKRLRHNEREAERVRDELGDKINGEDRRELMELQYQVGRLELENMELEQHRIVHESILKGKDLVIQKLKLQLAVKEKIISRQETVLKDNGLSDKVGYQQLAMFEQSLGMGLGDDSHGPAGGVSIGANTALYATQSGIPDASPPRAVGALGVGTYVGGMGNNNNNKGGAPKQQRHPKVPLLGEGGAGFASGSGGGDDIQYPSDDQLEMSGSQEVYDDFTVEDPNRNNNNVAPRGHRQPAHNQAKAESFEKREKERLSKEASDGASAVQKRRELADRQQMQRAAREPPSSHHFFPGAGGGAAGGGAAVAAAAAGGGAGQAMVAPERQGAVIKKGSVVRRPKPNPGSGAKSSPRRSNPTVSSNSNAVAAEAADKERGSVGSSGSNGMGLLGVQGHGSNGSSGGLPVTHNSGGNGNGNNSGGLGPGPWAGGRGPRRPPNNYVPSSWESKEADEALHHQQQQQQRGKNVSPIHSTDNINNMDDMPRHVPQQPHGSAPSPSTSGGKAIKTYPNIYQHNNPPQPIGVNTRRNLVNSSVAQAQQAAQAAANAMNNGGNNNPPFIPQGHSVISADGYSEGTVYHASPDRHGGESKDGGMGNYKDNREMQRKMAAAGDGGGQQQQGQARPRRRPMGAGAGSRPKRQFGPGMDSGDDGSVYSDQEEGRSQNSLDLLERDDSSNGGRSIGGGESKQQDQQQSGLMQQQEAKRTPADRAFAAAQAQVEAHRKASLDAQVQVQQQSGNSGGKVAVGAAPKMRARPRIRPLGNKAAAAQSPEAAGQLLQQQQQQPIPGPPMQQVLSPGGTSYKQILSTASVSQAQRRAEGPSAALDRVRGLEVGNAAVGGGLGVPQASGLGGMNRPNQPTRIKANVGGVQGNSRIKKLSNPRSPEPN